MNSVTEYRPDIDGLRAIAVLSVIFHHFGSPWFDGGYVGVDVFFVISGYLITKIIWSDLNTHSFSISKFYERRARRIIPVLAVVILFSLVLGYFVLLPNDFENLGQSAIAASLFSGNILFWLKTDYFSVSSELMPLLHTWSLGVEEQFYIIWPLLLIAIAKISRKRQTIIVLAVLTGSFIASEFSLTYQETKHAFYLPHLRAWELLIGSVLAFTLHNAQHTLSIRQANCIGIVALGLLLFSIIGYSTQTRFPGVSALLPCLSTAALIYSGIQANQTSTIFLGNRIARYFGKISYSLYLWHWPVLVFYKLITSQPPPIISALILLSLTWALSHLSWRYVEHPFRIASKKPVGSFKPFLVSALCLVTLSTIGLAIHNRKGLPNRLPEQALFYNSYIKYESERSEECFVDDVYQQPQHCNLGEGFRKDRPHTLVWGDSHASHLLPLISKQLKDESETAVAATKNGCAPLLEIQEHLSKAFQLECKRFNDTTWQTILSTPEIQRVILAANWSLNKEGALSDDSSIEYDRKIIRDITSMVDILSKRKIHVTLVGALPVSAREPTMCLATNAFLNRDLNQCKTSPLRTGSIESELNSIFARLSQNNRFVDHIDLEAVLCSGQECRVELNRTPLYRDNNHLTAEGVMMLNVVLFPSPNNPN